MVYARWQSISALAITCALTLGLLVSSAHAQSASMTVRYEKAITVNHAPDGPWDVYITDTTLHPGGWPGPHTHPGPEYGMVISGTLVRWDDGIGSKNIASGGAYMSPWNAIHEGGNPSTSSDDTTFLSVHLLERGGAFAVPSPPDKAPAAAPKTGLAQNNIRLWQAKFALDTHPATPFVMTERYVEWPAGAMNQIKVAQTTLIAVVSGTITVSNNGTDTTYGPGKQWMSQAGDSITVANRADSPAAVFVVAMK